MAGSRCWRTRIGLVLLVLAFVAIVAADASPQKKGKSSPQRVPDTLILVSTFSDAGQTLRGTRVRLYPANQQGEIVKGKVLEGQTNNMGEFPFHVPKTDAHYVLVAEIKGFARTQKHVTVQQEDQLDVFLQLPAAR